MKRLSRMHRHSDNAESLGVRKLDMAAGLPNFDPAGTLQRRNHPLARDTRRSSIHHHLQTTTVRSFPELA